MTGATADREQACRAPGGERDRQPPTLRGAGVVVPFWDRASVLPVRVFLESIFIDRDSLNERRPSSSTDAEPTRPLRGG